MRMKDRLLHAWNAFTTTEGATTGWSYGSGYSNSNHRNIKTYGAASYASAIFNRMAMDVALSAIQHVKVDENNHEREIVNSGLHNCLNIEANIDQTGIQFMHDIVYSMFDEGSVAVVPVDTTISPSISGGYDINTMRVGKVTQWYPKHVTVNLYDERDGQKKDVTLPKAQVAIIENPLYAVVNGPNATLQRLLNKMSQVDNIDDLIAKGSLDMIIQLPHAVKTELQKRQAKERVENIEKQLNSNSRGIAYIDGAEKFTQLNRPINDKMVEEIDSLSQQFYNQLGLTETIFNGTASESEMRNYYTRTIDPMLNAILAEFTRKFLTKTARSQGHKLEAYRDVFSIVPMQDLAKIADAFRRNEILTPNELRSAMGYKASNEPEANALKNPNIADKNQNPGSLTPPDQDDVVDQNE